MDYADLTRNRQDWQNDEYLYQGIIDLWLEVLHSFLRQSAMISVSLISIVDDDESVRESLEGLLKSVGFRVEAFALATDFLNSQALQATDCLILDVRMPGMSGPELQRQLIASQHSIPIVFITAHGDDAVRARVLGDGAVDCLLKPFNEDALLNAVNAALERVWSEIRQCFREGAKNDALNHASPQEAIEHHAIYLC